jgi:hypothetical protein
MRFIFNHVGIDSIKLNFTFKKHKTIDVDQPRP